MPLSFRVCVRGLVTSALLCVASTAFAVAMGEADARHLLARTGFGPTTAEVQAFATMSRDEAIDTLLRDARTTPVTAPPAWVDASTPDRRPSPDASEAERKAFREKEARRSAELRASWIREMLATPSPLTERMTLFWHNHFVSSQQKVRDARLMYAQNALFRTNALGSFATLLRAAAKDPAMVIYLDSVQNRKGAPNENFAREVMELFTLGQGRYTEEDIKEAARAFTGWSIERETRAFVFRSRAHDDGEKRVFGASGRFDGDAIIDLLLQRRETSEFIVAKLWIEFVSAEPDRATVERIARDFRAQRYDIKVALRELLQSNAFWSDTHRGTLVKSPVEIVVGTLRQLDVAAGDTLALGVVVAGMGQNLFSPPNVRGWPGGNAWINSNTLLARKQFLDRVARNDATPAPMTVSIGAAPIEVTDALAMVATRDATAGEMERAARLARAIDRSTRNLRFDAQRWIGQQDGRTVDDKLAFATRLLLPVAAVLPRIEDADATTAIHAALLDPAYQLK